MRGPDLETDIFYLDKIIHRDITSSSSELDPNFGIAVESYDGHQSDD